MQKQKKKHMGSCVFLFLMHYTLDFIDYTQEKNIILLGYPAHCTHALQGLDVVCFAKMKEVWKHEIISFEEENMWTVSKSDFTHLWSKAYKSAFTSETIASTFWVTGIHPFSHEVITKDQMKPSITTSIKGSFPLEQWGMTSWSRDHVDRFRRHVLSPQTNPTLFPWACDQLRIPCHLSIWWWECGSAYNTPYLAFCALPSAFCASSSHFSACFCVLWSWSCILSPSEPTWASNYRVPNCKQLFLTKALSVNCYHPFSSIFKH